MEGVPLSLRARKKEQTKQAIIASATKLFAEKGYEATRTREIAEAAGIATGTLFNYAKTKSDIVLLIWKARVMVVVQQGLAAAHQEPDPIEGVLAIFGPAFSFYAEDLELGKVFLQNAIYAQADDPEMLTVNEGFVAQLSIYLAPHVGTEAFQAAGNVFAAYYLVLTMMLAGRLPDVTASVAFFREMVKTQSRGWST